MLLPTCMLGMKRSTFFRYLCSAFALSTLLIFSRFGYLPFLSFENSYHAAQRAENIAKASSFLPDLNLNAIDNHTLSTFYPPYLDIAPAYISSFFKPDDTTFPRISCPMIKGIRYEHLRNNASSRPKYFFALSLMNATKILPRLMQSIVESIKFLGPENCVLSIVEGRSTDGTYEILYLLRTEIENLGAHYIFEKNDTDPTADNWRDRIGILAGLRNQALISLTGHPEKYAEDTMVIFLNDVIICAEDILELVYQKSYQQADMICAMDWNPDPYDVLFYHSMEWTFYDVWIARGMTGDSFFEITNKGSWKHAADTFRHDPESKAHLKANEPFQVYSCWNGAVVFSAKPLIKDHVRFRAHTAKESYQGEPQLFCKDLWALGYGKIAAVPAVSLIYEAKYAEELKKDKGYVSTHVDMNKKDDSISIAWKAKPPAMVKVWDSYTTQKWVPWDEGLRST